MNNKNKKILLAVGIYPPDIGGGATYAKRLKEALPGFGFELRVATYGESSSEGIAAVSRSKPLPLRYLCYFRELMRQRDWADLVYCFDQVSTGLPCAIFKVFNPKKKLIMRIGGDFLWEKAFNNGWTDKVLSEYYSSPKNLREKIFIKIYNFVFKQCDRIIFTTKWQRDITLKNFDLDGGKCTVIENAFPEKRTQADNGAQSSQILYAGRLVRVKNLERLLQVMKRVENFTLKIVGEGPYKEKLFERIKEYGLEQKVILQDRLPQNDLYKEMLASRFVIVPTISEVSPNTALEALALGVPVLLTRECGFYERWKDEVLFFNPLDDNDILEKIKYLQVEENYRKYREVIQNIDMHRGWEDIMIDHKKLIGDLIA